MIIYSTILTKILKYHAEGLAGTIDSVTEENISSVWKHKPLSSSSYIKLSEELNHSRKDLIHIQNADDNKCLE